MINFLVILKIYEYYPDRAAVIEIHDELTNLYSAGLFKYEEGSLGECLYSLPTFNYKTGNDAIEALINTVASFKQTVTTFSN